MRIDGHSVGYHRCESPDGKVRNAGDVFTIEINVWPQSVFDGEPDPLISSPFCGPTRGLPNERSHYYTNTISDSKQISATLDEVETASREMSRDISYERSEGDTESETKQ